VPEREAATIGAVPEGDSMKILFVMEHPGVGSLLPALRLLHGRGHHLHLAYDKLKSVESHRELEELAEECPGITFGELPPSDHSGWAALAAWLRRSIDYLRYLEPRYRDATKLRARARRKAPKAMRLVGRVVRLTGPLGVAGLRRTLQAVESCLAPPPEVERFLQEQQPDVLLPAHLLPIGTSHADYLRAAKRLGIRTVFPVRGWDNLTNKGLLRDAPDQVLVWNDLQAREAEELHRVPADHIRLVGAALCDSWFTWEVTRSREEFCQMVGLRDDRPIVLYVCSSGFVARNGEADFVRTWIEQLRARGEPFTEAGFLIRPHPLNAAQWADGGLDGPQVRVWPRFGEAPHDGESRRNFYDSMFHSAAVVGINTTAQIESAIVGRPVHTLLADEFRETQQGTLHFHYLKADEFGLLFVGRNFEEHAQQLAESVRGRQDDGRNERFLRRFVRPQGLDRPAKELIVDAIEELGSSPAPAPAPGPWLAPAVRLALAPLAALGGQGADRRRERSAARATPLAGLRRVVRKRAMHRTGAPVVCGPWLEDEIGELLYWIPFLRWTQGMSPGLRERLFVVCRASSLSWYGGIGGGVVGLDQLVRPDRPDLSAALSESELQGRLREHVARVFELGSRAFRVLPADLVVATRSDLARQKPPAEGQRRMLEFAPLAAPEAPAGLELPDEFLAVRFDDDQQDVVQAVAERAHVVGLDGLDRAAQAGVLARSQGFVGSYGVESYLGVLLGRPAVVLGAERADADDRTVASSFLARGPFGPLHVLDGAVSPAEVAEHAARLLTSPVEALAGV
jgi:hypothetical protein